VVQTVAVQKIVIVQNAVVHVERNVHVEETAPVLIRNNYSLYTSNSGLDKPISVQLLSFNLLKSHRSINFSDL